MKSVAIIGLCGVLWGCTGQSQQSSAPPSAPASPLVLKNPTEFPLAPHGRIIDVKAFSQTVAASGSSMLSTQGAGTYTGNEVLEASTQSSAALRAWLASLGQHPPAGYVLQMGSSASTGRTAQTLDLYGISYAAFRTADRAVNRGVVIVVVDPKLVKQKLGMALDLIERYRSLPEALRDPVDRQVKEKTGFTVTQATDPSSPLGMTLSALHELQNSDERAVVVIDGTKK